MKTTQKNIRRFHTYTTTTTTYMAVTIYEVVHKGPQNIRTVLHQQNKKEDVFREQTSLKYFANKNFRE